MILCNYIPAFWNHNYCHPGEEQSKRNWVSKQSHPALQRQVLKMTQQCPNYPFPGLSMGNPENIQTNSQVSNMSQAMLFVSGLPYMTYTKIGYFVIPPSDRYTVCLLICADIKIKMETPWHFTTLYLFTCMDVISTIRPLSPPETCGKRLSFITNPRLGDHPAVFKRWALSPVRISAASAIHSTQLPHVPIETQ